MLREVKGKRGVLAAVGVMAVVAVLAIWYWRSEAEGRRALLPAPPDLSGAPASLASGVQDAARAAQRSPNNLQTWMELGQTYHANGFLQEASSCYEVLLAWEDAGLPVAQLYYYLGDIAKAQGRDGDALDWYGRSSTERADYVPTYLSMGEILLKSGESEAGMKTYREALRYDADNPHAKLALAREYARLGEDERAISALEDLYRANAQFSAGRGLWAQLLERNGNPERAAQARASIRRGAVLPPEDPWMNELIEHSYDVQRLSIRYEDYKNAGDLTGAFRFLDRVELLEPENWTAQLLRGIAFAETGRVLAAADRYRQALQFGGEPATIYTMLIKALVSTKQFEEAEKVALEAAGIVPQSVDVLVELAGVYLVTNRRREAIELFERSLTIDPYHVRARRYLGDIYWLRGDRERALSNYRTLLEVDPENAPARLKLGLHELEGGRLAEAQSQFAHASMNEVDADADRSEWAHAWLELGRQQAQAGRVDEALASFDRSVAVQPDAVEARVAKTELLVHTKRYEQAEAAMVELVALKPQDPGAHVAMGDIQFAKGDTESARISWQRAAELADSKEEADLRAALATRLRQVGGSSN